MEEGDAVHRQKAPLVAGGRSWQRKLWSCNDFHWPGRYSGQGGKHGFAPWLWVEEKHQRGTEKFPRGIHRGREQGQAGLPSRAGHLHAAGVSAGPGISLRSLQETVRSLRQHPDVISNK